MSAEKEKDQAAMLEGQIATTAGLVAATKAAKADPSNPDLQEMQGEWADVSKFQHGQE